MHQCFLLHLIMQCYLDMILYCTNDLQYLFAAHSWTTETPRGTHELFRQDILSCEQLVDGYSFSNLNITKDQDLSFRGGSPLNVNSDQECSPVFLCQSSFSSSQFTPPSVPGAVRSGSCCKPCSHEPVFSSPIPSMPSFTFSTHGPAFEPTEESLCFKTKILSIDGGMPFLKQVVMHKCYFFSLKIGCNDSLVT